MDPRLKDEIRGGTKGRADGLDRRKPVQSDQTGREGPSQPRVVRQGEHLKLRQPTDFSRERTSQVVVVEPQASEGFQVAQFGRNPPRETVLLKPQQLQPGKISEFGGMWPLRLLKARFSTDTRP